MSLPPTNLKTTSLTKDHLSLQVSEVDSLIALCYGDGDTCLSCRKVLSEETSTRLLSSILLDNSE